VFACKRKEKIVGQCSGNAKEWISGIDDPIRGFSRSLLFLLFQSLLQFPNTLPQLLVLPLGMLKL
jgi:hypothetical protein